MTDHTHLAEDGDPSRDSREHVLSSSTWLMLARGSHWVCGIGYFVWGIAFAALLHDDPELSQAAWLGVSVCMFLVFGGFGATHILAARGLRHGAKWAWIATVILGGMYLLSACLPVGAIFLYTMLRDVERKVFLG